MSTQGLARRFTGNQIYRGIVLLAVVTVALRLPAMASPYLLRVATTTLVLCCLAVGLNLILGYAGLLNFGHAAFYGVGAYTVAILMTDHGLPFLTALVVGIGLSGLAGAAVGATAWRVRGDYLALVTLGFAQIALLVMNNWVDVTKGPAGLPGVPLPTIFGFEIDPAQGVYYLAAVGAAVALLIAAIITRTYFGRALLTLREDEIVARAYGINVPALKVGIFAIGCGIAGLAGGLQAVSLGYVGPNSFGLDQSITVVEVVILGGVATTWGPLIGAVLIEAITEGFRFAPVYRPAVLGGVMIIILIIRSDGIAGILRLGRADVPGVVSIKRLARTPRRIGLRDQRPAETVLERPSA